jgi:hypothetical protein
MAKSSAAAAVFGIGVVGVIALLASKLSGTASASALPNAAPQPVPGRLTVSFSLKPAPAITNNLIAAVARAIIPELNKCGPVQISAVNQAFLVPSASAIRVTFIYDALFPATFPPSAPLSAVGTACVADVLKKNADVGPGVSAVLAGGDLIPAVVPKAPAGAVNATKPVASADVSAKAPATPTAPHANAGKLTISFMLSGQSTPAVIQQAARTAMPAINKAGPIQVSALSQAGTLPMGKGTHVDLVYEATFPPTFPSSSPLSAAGTAHMAAIFKADPAIGAEVSNVQASGQLKPA